MRNTAFNSGEKDKVMNKLKSQVSGHIDRMLSMNINDSSYDIEEAVKKI